MIVMLHAAVSLVPAHVHNVQSPSPSKLPFSASWIASSVASIECSRHVSPLSERRMTISRSLPRSDAKWGTSMITGLEIIHVDTFSISHWRWVKSTERYSSSIVYVVTEDDNWLKTAFSIYIPKEFGANRAHLQHSACQCLSLHKWWWMCQFLLLDQFAGHSGRHAGLGGRNDDAHTGVTAASHRTTASVNHEAYQETAKYPITTHLLSYSMAAQMKIWQKLWKAQCNKKMECHKISF